MFAIVRTITYATIFVGVLLVYLPARILAWSGITRPAVLAWPQIAGIVVVTAGALVALCCLWAFAWIGIGTPAPFDLPRRAFTPEGARNRGQAAAQEHQSARFRRGRIGGDERFRYIACAGAPSRERNCT
jgi:hypothetical protein